MLSGVAAAVTASVRTAVTRLPEGLDGAIIALSSQPVSRVNPRWLIRLSPSSSCCTDAAKGRRRIRCDSLVASRGGADGVGGSMHCTDDGRNCTRCSSCCEALSDSAFDSIGLAITTVQIVAELSTDAARLLA